MVCAGDSGYRGVRASFSVRLRKGLREEMVLGRAGAEKQEGEGEGTFQAEGPQKQAHRGWKMWGCCERRGWESSWKSLERQALSA